MVGGGGGGGGGGGRGGDGELVAGDGRGAPPPCTGTCVNPGSAATPIVGQYVVVLVPEVARLTAFMVMLSSQVQRTRFYLPL